MGATCVTTGEAAWGRGGVFMWSSCACCKSQNWKDLCGNRVSPWCPGALIVVCSLYSRVALASLTVAGIITPVEVLTESCLASMWGLKENVGFKGKWAVVQRVGLGAGA